jgi:carbonic anhydrase
LSGVSNLYARTMTPEEALARLVAGNARFVAGTVEASHALVDRRAAVAEIQRPFALILCCADSRIAPEIVFDQRLGDLFVCRVGGNILEPGALGSFEFAITTVVTPAVLVVMGHQRCSALTASIEAFRSGVESTGAFRTIAEASAPAIAATAHADGVTEAFIDAVVRTNATLVAREISARSTIVRDAVAAGRMRVVPAHYSVDSGRVTLLPLAASAVSDSRR